MFDFPGRYCWAQHTSSEYRYPSSKSSNPVLLSVPDLHPRIHSGHTKIVNNSSAGSGGIRNTAPSSFTASSLITLPMSTSTKSPSAKRPLQMHFGNRRHWNNALLKSSEQVRTGKTLMNRTMTTNRLLHQLARLVRRQPRLLNIRLVLLDFGAWKWQSSSSSATSAWIRRVTTTKIIIHRHHVN